MFNRKYMRTKIVVVTLAIGHLLGVGPLAEEVVRAIVSPDVVSAIVESGSGGPDVKVTR